MLLFVQSILKNHAVGCIIFLELAKHSIHSFLIILLLFFMSLQTLRSLSHPILYILHHQTFHLMFVSSCRIGSLCINVGGEVRIAVYQSMLQSGHDGRRRFVEMISLNRFTVVFLDTSSQSVTF